MFRNGNAPHLWHLREIKVTFEPIRHIPPATPYAGNSPKNVGWGDKLEGGADRKNFHPIRILA